MSTVRLLVTMNKFNFHLLMVEGEQQQQEEREHEGAQVKIRKTPNWPSEKDVEEHYAANHVPYRSWCRVCVMAKGVNTGHRRIEEEERQAS